MQTADYLRALADDIEAVARAIEAGPPDAAIAGCPGWTLSELGQHLGGVQRWARQAILHSEPPTDRSADPPPDGGPLLATWLRAGGDRLLDALRAIDPAAPTWHPFPVPKVAGVWPRRQCQEASVHRWDAQHAIGLDATIDAALASDGIDEYFGVMLPRMLSREGRVAPPSVIEVAAVDTHAYWLIDGAEGIVTVVDGVEPVARLEGTAQAVLLRLWGRPVPDSSITLSGDVDAVAAWLALGGA